MDRPPCASGQRAGERARHLPRGLRSPPPRGLGMLCRPRRSAIRGAWMRVALSPGPSVGRVSTPWGCEAADSRGERPRTRVGPTQARSIARCAAPLRTLALRPNQLACGAARVGVSLGVRASAGSSLLRVWPAGRLADQSQVAGCSRGTISRSSMRSVGARMNTSHMMSGSCWLPLMKPITLLPVAFSITAVNRPRIRS